MCTGSDYCWRNTARTAHANRMTAVFKLTIFLQNNFIPNEQVVFGPAELGRDAELVPAERDTLLPALAVHQRLADPATGEKGAAGRTAL